jgi:hypothetical protein
MIAGEVLRFNDCLTTKVKRIIGIHIAPHTETPGTEDSQLCKFINQEFRRPLALACGNRIRTFDGM